MKNVIIGIDLGTTNSAVSIVENGKPKIIANAEGANTTPSIIGFATNGEVLVGQIAKRQAVTNSKNTLFGVKRLIGRKFTDEEIKQFIKIAPFQIVGAKNGDAWVKVSGKEYSPQELSSKIIEKLKKAAEDYLGHAVTDAVITVPAAFNSQQREATKDAGKIAGLNVRRIINEPTAAILAYGLDKKKEEEHVVVVDYGGGTTDCSVGVISPDGLVEIIASVGDTFLGGEDIDHRILDYLLAEFKKESGVELKNDTMALQRLKEAAEKAKMELSTVTNTDINLPFITADSTGPKHFNVALSRAKMESLIEDLVDKMIHFVELAVKESGFEYSKINEIILVGGTTRIPLIQEKLKKLFKGKELSKSVNPDEVVAAGAAVQGAILSGDVKDVLLLDVAPLSLGIETMGNVMTKIIEKNTTIPTRKSQVFSTAADNQPAVSIHVLQGERPMSKDNKSLTKFDLTGINPAPRGVPQIEVSFDIDANGIVHVSAKDVATGKEQKVQITTSSGLTKEEIDRIIRDAEENRLVDEEKRKTADAKNSLESMIFQVDKMIKENSDKLSTEDKEELSNAVASARSVADSDSYESLESAYKTLETVVHSMSAKMNNNSSGQQEHRQEPETAEPYAEQEEVQGDSDTNA